MSQKRNAPAKAAMPRRVKVCSHHYSMHVETARLNNGIMGLHDSYASEITLCGNMTPEHTRAIAVHELLHAIDLVSGSGMSEQDVTAFSAILYGVMRDNPQLVRWLMEW